MPDDPDEGATHDEAARDEAWQPSEAERRVMAGIAPLHIPTEDV